MAFDRQGLQVMSSSNPGTANLYAYKNTSDTLATIKASAYFNLVINSLRVGDGIWLYGSDGAQWVRVTSVTTNVTVADTVVAADIELAQGNVLVGNASGLAAAVDLSAGGNILVGNDTTAAALDASGDGQIVVGNGTTITSVAVSGDATLANDGALTIANDAIETAMIADDNVTLAKLAPGITPAYVPIYGGEETWSGGGDSLAITVTGAIATDIVIATFQNAPSEASYIASAVATSDTVTVTLSAANTSNDCVIGYLVMRAAA